MMYSRKALRNMPTQTRSLARMLNELESVHRRARNLLPKIQQAEFEARALWAAEAARLETDIRNHVEDDTCPF